MQKGSLIYHNPLATADDVKDFVLEGRATVRFAEGGMELHSVGDESEGQRANYVYWCPEEFPSDVWIEWKFWPLAPRGLCILFFSARGRNGEEIFHPSLSPRTGQYKQYHSGDINAFHVSYYRRRGDDVLDLCNLRKSHGFHLVATGADPIPTSEYAEPPYTLEVIKVKNEVRFRVHGLEVFQYVDDESHGPLLGGGKIGFRQMAPMVGRYADLKVFSVG